MTPAAAPPSAVAPMGRMLAAQVRAGLLAYRRMPAFLVLSFGLPLMFFVLFGLPNVGHSLPDGTSLGSFVLASLGAYAVGNVLFYNVGIGIANQRGRKQDLLQRATPLPSAVVVASNVVSGLVLAAVSLTMLFAVAFAGGVHLPPLKWLELGAILLVGCLPILGLGLSLGYGASVSAAPGLASIIFLPMAFASGLFIPIRQLPSLVQKVSPFLPLYHYGQLGWNVVGGADESFGIAVLWTIGWSIVLLGLAARAYTRDQNRKFN
ncbi:MAG: ABC transporter permease [Candidatus Dormibacteraeota bacterium]|nr:ABC transporter permease [Candidatus Dormibacteraeota bacterium]